VSDPTGGAIPLAQAVEEYLDWQALVGDRSGDDVAAMNCTTFIKH
jgi:hypothetical protein